LRPGLVSVPKVAIGKWLANGFAAVILILPPPITMRPKLLSAGERAVCGFDAADVVASHVESAVRIGNGFPAIAKHKLVACLFRQVLFLVNHPPPLRHRRMLRRGVPVPAGAVGEGSD